MIWLNQVSGVSLGKVTLELNFLSLDAASVNKGSNFLTTAQYELKDLNSLKELEYDIKSLTNGELLLDQFLFYSQMAKHNS